MAKYEKLPTVTLPSCKVQLRKHHMPELVHMDDPAYLAMIDFRQTVSPVISPKDTIDAALHEMQVSGAHLLLVEDDQQYIIGVVSSEDLLGEKPIKILQERRIPRANLLVKMLMIPIDQMAAFDIQAIERAKVGNIAVSLKLLKKHYAIVVDTHEQTDIIVIRGLLSTSQLSRQLHMDVANLIAEAENLSELSQRKR